MDQAAPGAPGRGRNLPQAVVTAAVLLVVAGGAYALGSGFFFWLAVVVVGLALFELLDAPAQAGRKPVIPFGVGCGLGLMIAAYYAPDRPAWLVVVLVVTLVGAFALSLRPGRGPSPATDTAWTIAAVVWIGGGGAAAVSMLTLEGGLNLLVVHVLITALDDVGAFFVGTSIGRHKLAPSISPGKSWEGVGAGFIVALVAGAAAGAALDELSPAHGLAVAAIIGVLAPIGDLAASMAKREFGIKDSGRLLPGHGGMLDRVDAIVFSAPGVLLYLRIFV